MRLYEYEGKILFKNLNIPVPRSSMANTIEDAKMEAEKIGYPVVIKAQVLQGGRGKAGLIKKVGDEKELIENSAEIFKKIKHSESLLIEECINATNEGYIGITIDDVIGVPVIIINKKGGIHIEEIAAESKPAKLIIDPIRGIYKYQLIDLALDAGYQGELLVKISDLAYKLYNVFKQYEADTVEINPVLINENTGEIWAGDSKVITDDYAIFRQPMLAELEKNRKTDTVKSDSLSYVNLGGNIGIVSVGASNTMMLVDTIKYLGGLPANFIDITGSNRYEVIVNLYIDLLKKFEEDNMIKAVMINFTLTAQPLENYVATIAEAIKKVKPHKKFIACIRASGAAVSNMSLKEGNELLEDAGVITYKSLEEAVNECVRLSKQYENGGIT